MSFSQAFFVKSSCNVCLIWNLTENLFKLAAHIQGVGRFVHSSVWISALPSSLQLLSLPPLAVLPGNSTETAAESTTSRDPLNAVYEVLFPFSLTNDSSLGEAGLQMFWHCRLWGWNVCEHSVHHMSMDRSCHHNGLCYKGSILLKQETQNSLFAPFSSCKTQKSSGFCVR